VRLPTMDWNWKVTLPLPLHGKAHVVNVVHAYMSPPSSAVMGEAQFGRNLSVAYYPRLPVHLDQRRRSAQSCWWMTTPSLGNREHPFRPLDPSTITEPVSIETIPPNGVVNRPFISRLGKLSLEGCAPLASLCSKLRDVPYRMTKKILFVFYVRKLLAFRQAQNKIRCCGLRNATSCPTTPYAGLHVRSM
jgi:hypothetical protein